jgi:predicted RNA-binding Zn-ribbon protein involved in translation (DUF1610 family)
MSTSEIIPRRIFHPKCANCGTQMWLSQIKPDTSGHQQRTFECSKCGNAAVKIVKPLAASFYG